MAVIKSISRRSREQPALVDQLAEELARNAHSGQPFVYINNVGQTGTLHVTVIWDAWKDLSSQQRASVIMEAMEKQDVSTSGHITIAMGLTGDEARRLGLLRYKILPIFKGNDNGSRRQIEQLLRDEGAFETGDGLQLLFRSEEQATEAYSRLQDKDPKNHWALVREEIAGE